MRTPKAILAVRYKELARRVLWGQPHSEIMHEMALSMRQFQDSVKTPEFQAELEALQKTTYSELDTRLREELETVQSRARRKSIEAVDKLIHLMEASASEALQRDCANDLIKYSGQGEAAKRPIVNISAATVQLINAARSEDDHRGRTVDVDAEP